MEVESGGEMHRVPLPSLHVHSKFGKAKYLLDPGSRRSEFIPHQEKHALLAFLQTDSIKRGNKSPNQSQLEET